VASRVRDEKGRPAQSPTTFADLQAELFADGFSFSGYERDLVALNLGDGRYLDISGISGADSVTDGRGSVFADFDNDGDLDIFLRAIHGKAHHLFRNNVGSDSGFLRVTLRGTASGTDAFGAEVRIKTSAGIQTKVKAGGSGFVSQSDPRLLFGLGGDGAAEWLEVTWPSGKKQRFAGPAAGSSMSIIEGREEPVIHREKRFSLPDPQTTEERKWHAFGLDPESPVDDVVIELPGGEKRRLSDLVNDGETLLLNFWATWCRPCALEMPELQRLHRRAGSRMQVVGLNVEPEIGDDSIEAFLKKLGVTYPIARISPAAIERLLGTSTPGVPLSIVLDSRLRPREVLAGWSEETAAHLEALAKGPASSDR
jgi:thiol-disulfide isomerase/thioredoxin